MMQNIVSKNLNKYLTSREYYNGKVITDIIYNENTNLVSVFKDYLILDDISEFLKRQYSLTESKDRIPKVVEFYEKYSKVFPNYISLPESKFMFKNIERKQRFIDEKQRISQKIKAERNEKERKRRKYYNPEEYSIDLWNRKKLFTKSFEDSMLRLDEQSLLERATRHIPTEVDKLVQKF